MSNLTDFCWKRRRSTYGLWGDKVVHVHCVQGDLILPILILYWFNIIITKYSFDQTHHNYQNLNIDHRPGSSYSISHKLCHTLPIFKQKKPSIQYSYIQKCSIIYDKVSDQPILISWYHMSPGNGGKWKWPNVVGKSEMDLFWCISMTNNVKSCKKIKGRVQTFRFSVFTMGGHWLTGALC